MCMEEAMAEGDKGSGKITQLGKAVCSGLSGSLTLRRRVKWLGF